ncbi:MAG: hypothetical protein LUF35_00110 [Lachnospiraceae bacterium]|nr:hypothetical protein [Lachnospiraceae bacterium]
MANLFCGAAKAEITPEKELIPNLRALSDKRFGGVFGPLYVRGIAIKNESETVLLIALELDKVPYPKEILRELSEKTGIPERNILYFSVNTHSAPVTGYRPFERGNDTTRKSEAVQEATRRYEEAVKTAVFRAVEEAIDGMRPARIGYGTGKSYINVNSSLDYVTYKDDGTEIHQMGSGDNFEGPVDHTVFVMRMEDTQGVPIAFLVNYAVHCSVMMWNRCVDGKIGISADLAGEVSGYMEKHYPGAVSVWSSGAAADVNALMMTHSTYPNPDTGMVDGYTAVSEEFPAAILKKLSSLHFADILRVAQKIHCTDEEPDIKTGVSWCYVPSYLSRNDVTGIPNVTEQPGGEPFDIRLQKVEIGGMAFVGVSGELCTTLGWAVQESARRKTVVIINHNACMLAHGGRTFDDETYERCSNSAYRKKCLAGMNQFTARPGYIKAALQQSTEELFG